MKPAEEIELADLNLNPAKKYGKSLQEKRFMLNIFTKYNIKWQPDSLLSQFCAAVLPFWVGPTFKVSDLIEQDTDKELAKIDPQIPKEPCVVGEIILNEFTYLSFLDSSDQRILSILSNLHITETQQIRNYANNGNSVAQLLLSFICVNNSDANNAKIYLEQSAKEYDLAKFFLCRNKLFGNKKWNITQDTRSAINDIQSLTKAQSIYTIVGTLLLFNAYCNRIINLSELDNRSSSLVKIIINEKASIQRASDAMKCRGARIPDEEKLSHVILNNNSLYDSEMQPSVNAVTQQTSTESRIIISP